MVSRDSPALTALFPPIANSGSPAPSFITHVLGFIFFTPDPAFFLTLFLASKFTKDLFRKLMQVYIEDCHQLVLAPAPLAKSQKDALNKSFKARNPDIYYDNLHIECYYFCQQCKENFEIAGAKNHKRVFFASTFLKNRILNCFQQYQTWTKYNQVVLLFYKKFKTFLRKSFVESHTFIG